jgi:DNA-binding NarL/FixJ family response regulator
VTIRVLVADDQALVRAGFRTILESDPGISVVAEAADGIEAVQLARHVKPDVVLMDIQMPRLDGIAATRELVSAGDGDDEAVPRVLILTTFRLDEYVYDALRAGASGFLLKDVQPEMLLEGVRVVHAGDALLDRSVTRAVVEAFGRRPAPDARWAAALAELTPREREVLDMLARGRSNAEIAETLVISHGTARSHVGHVLMKLGLRDRVQAVIYAYESGFVEVGATTNGKMTMPS